jgi:hypothetical protein
MDSTIGLLDVVALTVDHPEKGLRSGGHCATTFREPDSRGTSPAMTMEFKTHG